jgi:hypothetical protein
VLSRFLTPILVAFLTAGATAQLTTAPAPAAKSPDKPQVQVNYLNVCTPSSADQQMLESVLSRIAAKPVFAVDMEISRGRSTLNPSDLVINTGQPTAQTNSVSRWVRIRRDFPDSSPLTGAQYSFSVSEKHVSETLVFHFRDIKDVLQVSINDSVEAAQDPGQVARVQTPADRIRVERFGKSSVVLARCPTADQSTFEPIFQHATSLLNSYRRAFNIAGTVPAELTRLGGASPSSVKKPDPAAPRPQ